jgi:hypothetical protein
MRIAMDEMMIGRKIFLALSIVVMMGVLVVPSTAATWVMVPTNNVNYIDTSYSAFSNAYNPSACSNACLADSRCLACKYMHFTSWTVWSCYLWDKVPTQTVAVPADLTVIYYQKVGVTTVPPQYGSIKISSTPSGAEVYVDSVYKGLTPYTFTNVNTGSHSIELTLSGYDSQTKSVTVTANQMSQVSFTLKATEGSPCDDGNPCTVNDVIKGGVCTPGAPLTCDDKNPNTEDTCNPATGACVFTIKTEGSSCDDGNKCTVNDVMKGGACTPGAPLTCDDKNSNTEDTCNPATGACIFTIKPEGSSCDDKNPCTVNDVMKGGACTPGTPLTCDDNNPTTGDTCDPKSGCVYTPLKPMRITFTSSSLTVEPDKPASLIITVVGADSIPITGAAVELSVPPGTALVPNDGVTVSSGKLPSTFIASKEGTYTITATVVKDGYLTGSETLTITAKSEINLMGILPFILIIAIIAIIVLFLLTRNRLQLIVKTTSVPADGRSTIPVKVQFGNGLGSLKNQSVDRDVSLTATSGTIKPVLIARGKAFAETPLTASREVGKVKVTAQYGNQQAETWVNFTIEGGMIEISTEQKELAADGMSAAMITLRLKDKGNIPISFIDEKTVQISTTLGTIPGSIRIPSRATEVKTSFAPGTMSGIAVITVMVDQLKGETTVRIGTLAERFCQRCGTKISMVAGICPNCRQSPTIPDTDTKQCPFCKEELPKTAVYCNKCGRNQA